MENSILLWNLIKDETLHTKSVYLDFCENYRKNHFIVISGWKRYSYFSLVKNVFWSLTIVPKGKELEFGQLLIDDFEKTQTLGEWCKMLDKKSVDFFVTVKPFSYFHLLYDYLSGNDYRENLEEKTWTYSPDSHSF